MSVPAIEIKGVRKAFRHRGRESGAPWWRREWKEKVALHELDLRVEAGGITGILGPNGSGKSTLIRVLATLLTPDAGTAKVFGRDVVTQAVAVRRHVNRVRAIETLADGVERACADVSVNNAEGGERERSETPGRIRFQLARSAAAPVSSARAGTSIEMIGVRS